MWTTTRACIITHHYEQSKVSDQLRAHFALSKQKMHIQDVTQRLSFLPCVLRSTHPWPRLPATHALNQTPRYYRSMGQ